MNGAFQKHLYHHQMIQQNTEMLFATHAHFPFTIYACMPAVIICHMCSLRRIGTESCFLHMLYTHHFHMILHTARFLCVLLYTQKFALMPPVYPHNSHYHTMLIMMNALPKSLLYVFQHLVGEGWGRSWERLWTRTVPSYVVKTDQSRSSQGSLQGIRACTYLKEFIARFFYPFLLHGIPSPPP